MRMARSERVFGCAISRAGLVLAVALDVVGHGRADEDAADGIGGCVAVGHVEPEEAGEAVSRSASGAVLTDETSVIVGVSGASDQSRMWRTSRLSPSHGEEVTAGAQQGWFGFERPDEAKDRGPPPGVVPLHLEVLKQPGRPFNRDGCLMLQASRANLFGDLFWSVQVRRREIGLPATRAIGLAIAVLALCHIAAHDRLIHRIVKEVFAQAVQRGLDFGPFQAA